MSVHVTGRAVPRYWADAPQDVQDLFEQLSNEIGLDITITGGQGRYNELVPADSPERAAGVILRPWTTQDANHSRHRVDHLPISTHGNHYLQSPEDTLDPSEHVGEPYRIDGALVAEVSERAVDYPFPWYLQLDDGFGFVFEKLIRVPVLKSLALAESGAVSEQSYEAGLEALREYGREAPERLLETVRRRVTSLENNVTEYQGYLTSAYGQLREVKAEADALVEAAARPEEFWVDLWDRLAGHPRVTRATFESGKLVVITDDITMSWPSAGTERWLGRFRIEYKLDAVNPGRSGVKFTNLDTPRMGRHHPHVTEDGSPCFGDMAPAISKLTADLNLVTLFEYCLAFLEDFNEHDDYGRYAARWFEAPDARPTTTTTEELVTA